MSINADFTSGPRTYPERSFEGLGAAFCAGTRRSLERSSERNIQAIAQKAVAAPKLVVGKALEGAKEQFKKEHAAAGGLSVLAEVTSKVVGAILDDKGADEVIEDGLIGIKDGVVVVASRIAYEGASRGAVEIVTQVASKTLAKKVAEIIPGYHIVAGSAQVIGAVITSRTPADAKAQVLEIASMTGVHMGISWLGGLAMRATVKGAAPVSIPVMIIGTVSTAAVSAVVNRIIFPVFFSSRL